MSRTWTLEQDVFLKENYLSMSYAQMGVKLGIASRYRNRVYRRCKKLGYMRRSGVEFNQEYFDIWSHNMAYILGLIASDGNVFYKPGKNYDLTIRLSCKDTKILEEIRIEIGMEKPLAMDVGVAACRLSLSSEYLIKRLMGLGIVPNKTKILGDIPVPDEFLSSFVRGYFDGDGSIHFIDREKSPYLSVRAFSASRDILDGMKKRIERVYGGVPKVKKNSSGLYEIEVGCKKGIKFLDWVYSEGGLRMERKYVEFEKGRKYYERKVHNDSRSSNRGTFG